jgi:hypothetical protein
MYDINFFAVYKKKKAKGGGVRVFIIVFLLLYVVANALLIGYGLLTMNNLKASIAEKDAMINSQETKDKIAEASKIKKQATLTAEYLTLLQRSSNKLYQMDLLDSALLDEIRKMTPPTTWFSFTEYNGILVNLECVSSSLTDPMDMYHSFLENKIFATVTLSGITVMDRGDVHFTLICQLAGGESK